VPSQQNQYCYYFIKFRTTCIMNMLT